MDFKRESKKFVCQGMQLTRPVDSLAEGKYAILRNVRAYLDGTIVPRPGITSSSASFASPAHSIKRYYDRSSGTIDEIVGASDKLYMGNNPVAIDTGYSTSPLSFVPYRPLNSSETYMYLSDINKMRKVDKGRNVFNVGIAPPNMPVGAVIGAPSYTVLESFEAVGAWTNGGTAGAISLIAAKRVNTTITYALYDTGTTGWVCVVPASMTKNIQPGALLVVNAAETVKVERVFNAITNTTIGSIKYDSGTSGLCTIQLTSTPIEGLERDAIVRIAAAENVRILSITTGPDGVPSFRCLTVSTRSAGDAIAGLASFRTYTTINHVAAETVTDEAFESTLTTGIGYITKAASYDLSTVSNRPIKPDDIIHISIKTDIPGNLTEGKILLNVDPTTDFGQNYYYYSFRANDLQAAATDTLTALTTQSRIVQNTQISQSYSHIGRGISDIAIGDYTGGRSSSSFTDDTLIPIDPVEPIVPADQAVTGANQWTELKFKVGDLLDNRVGSDSSKSLANVNAIRIQLNVTGSTVVNIDSLWIGGTYGLTSESFPYVYTYRYRASATGATSNPAPPLRTGVLVDRGRVVLTPTTSSDTQVDKIDYFRWGGTLIDWHLVGTTANSGTFTDTFPDEQISNNIGLDDDNFQPFPFLDKARTGTCDVVGTEVTRISGDTFNTSWSRGSLIIIDGVPTSLYNSPTSTSRLSLEDTQGTKTGVTFFLPSPTLMAQPSTTIWGPYSIGGATFLFGCKDGILLYTKGNNPDSAPEDHQLEITSPQEPLINGCIYDGQCFVFSTERLFRIIPNFSQEGNLFLAEEMPIGKGLFAPWALCVGELINFVSRDGIYQTNGTQLKSITDEDLYPLFPHDGIVGTEVNGISPPDFTVRTALRLAAGDGLIKFIYFSVQGNYNTLVYDTRFKGWVSNDQYALGATVHYWDEGGSSNGSTATRERIGISDGHVYTSSGTTDNGAAFTSVVRTASLDLGDSRAEKLFGDVMVDLTTGSGTVSTTIGYDNYSTTEGPFSLTQTTRGQSVVDILSGAGREAKNIALNLSFLSGENTVLYEWQPSYVSRPEDSKRRYMDYTDDNYKGAKWLQGIVLTCDTGGVTRSIQVQGDGGIVIATLLVNHNGYSTVAYPKAGDTWTPRVTHLMRLVPLDSSEWKVYNMEWVWEPSPETAIKWQSQGTSHGFEDFHHLRRAWIAIESNSSVILTLTADGVDYTYTLTSTGGVRDKILLPLQAVKAKLFTYKFTATQPFRLFLQDSVVETIGWGQSGMYQNVRPFGDVHHGQTEARI